MIDKESIKAALEDGHKASSVLRDVLGELIVVSCLKRKTWWEDDCRVCLVCVAKEVMGERDN